MVANSLEVPVLVAAQQWQPKSFWVTQVSANQKEFTVLDSHPEPIIIIALFHTVVTVMAKWLYFHPMAI